MDSSPRFFNYPKPEQLELPFKPRPAENNPVLSGVPLSIAASLCSAIPAVPAYLWRNAGFGVLRTIPALENAAYRVDPTVIPIPHDPSALNRNTETPLANIDPSRRPSAEPESRFYTVADYHEAYKSGKLTPTAVVEALLPLILRDATPRSKHATTFVNTIADAVRKAAEASTQRHKRGKPLGLLDGVPCAVKDETQIKGYARTGGTKRIMQEATEVSSWCNAKLEEQGAIMMGTTNMHEVGMDVTGNNPNIGTPLNPYNEAYYPGGSSSGSATAVSSGLLPFTVGADGGGSIRIPSSYCGIYGLKPSHGRVSPRPKILHTASTTVVGPMAANMLDLDAAFRVMAIPDPEHSTSANFPAPGAMKPSGNKVLGVYRPWIEHSAEAPVKEAFYAALDYLTTKRGYKLIDVSVPLVSEGQMAHALSIMGEVSVVFNDTSYLTPANRIILAVGSNTRSIDWMAAQKVRHVMMKHLAYLYQTHPGLIIVYPTTPNLGNHISGGAADLKNGKLDPNMQLKAMTFITMANFCGLPALTCPVGYGEPVKGTEGKIPIALEGMGEWGADEQLIQWGYEVEEYLNGVVGRVRPKEGNWVDVMKLAAEKM